MRKHKRYLSCLYCSRRLLECLIPEDNELQKPKFFIEATCPYCVGKSNRMGINKDLSTSPYKGLVIKDNQTTTVDGCDYFKFIMEKE